MADLTFSFQLSGENNPVEPAKLKTFKPTVLDIDVHWVDVRCPNTFGDEVR